MSIDTDILITYGATVNRIKKNTAIFSQGEKARYYFQILEGQVKVFSFNSSQKEYVHGLFNAGDSFGEPSLFIEEPYASNAVATKETILLRLNKSTFFDILRDQPEIQMQMLRLFAQKINDKAFTVRILNTQSPEQRILEFLEHYKKKSSTTTSRILIPFTRQELASLTGLRIETVIRTLRKMYASQEVDIIDHKVYY
jgi:CRP/FNR family transcriptional regulator